jgi:hypothetical protein
MGTSFFPSSHLTSPRFPVKKMLFDQVFVFFTLPMFSQQIKSIGKWTPIAGLISPFLL